MKIDIQGISVIESFIVYIFFLTFTKYKKSLLFEDPRISGARANLLRFSFLVLFIDIDRSTLLGWCTGNGRDSSVGRAEDWKSSCHQFKSGSWHVNNVSDRYFLIPHTNEINSLRQIGRDILYFLFHFFLSFFLVPPQYEWKSSYFFCFSSRRGIPRCSLNDKKPLFYLFYLYDTTPDFVSISINEHLEFHRNWT